MTNKMYRKKDEDLLKEIFILGKTPETIKLLYENDFVNLLGNVDNVLKILTDLSKGRCINKDCMLLCLARLYAKDSGSHNKCGEKLCVVCKVILELCRIPTDLFKLLSMLFNESYEFSDCGSYETSLKLPVKKLRKKVVSTFIPKHKFISQWYTGIARNAYDLLQLTTKFRQRHGWTHCTLIRYGHIGVYPNKSLANVKENVPIMISTLLIKEEVSENSSSYAQKSLNEGALDHDVIAAIDMPPLTKTKFEESHIEEVVDTTRPIEECDKEETSRLCLAPMKENENNVIASNLIDNSPGGISKEEDQKEEKDIVLKYIMRGKDGVVKDYKQYYDSNGTQKPGIRQNLARILCFIHVLEFCRRHRTKVSEIVQGIKNRNRVLSDGSYGGKMERLHICIEHLPTELYKEIEIWKAILPDLPMTAFLRHLWYLYFKDVFDDPESLDALKKAFRDTHRILYGYIHPIKILQAFYEFSSKMEAHNNDERIAIEIFELLIESFHLSLKRDQELTYIERKCVICIDVSISMTNKQCNPLTSAMKAVAMATGIQKSIGGTELYLCRKDKVELLPLEESFAFKLRKVEKSKHSKIDLSIPITKARKDKTAVDAFIFFTKSHICGDDPYIIFKKYQEEVGGANTKMIVCSMEANREMIADPEDANVFTLCGIDTNLIVEIYGILQK